jgi:farnesyl-diphosphate farnesyltransferase
MMRPSPSGRNPDVEWCHDAVQDVSRTFALTVESLDEPMATEICLGYLLCRIPDTIEDAGHVPPAAQSRLLRTYERAVDPDDDATMEAFVEAAQPQIPPEDERSDDWRVVAAAPRVLRAFETLPADARAAITPPVLELVGGMAEFVDRHAGAGGIRIADLAELEEYCYYAAGTVGELITNLLTRDDLEESRRDALSETAGSFALLLQLVNVATDVYDDYTEENNVYLPASWLDERGVEQESVLDPDRREAVANVVARTGSVAESYLDDAERYLTEMPLTRGNTLAAWGVPFLLAVGTLRELTADPAAALTEGGVAVTREEVYAVVEAMTHADRDELGALRAAVAQGPLHMAKTPVGGD